MSLDERIKNFRARLNGSVYNALGSGRLAEALTSEIKLYSRGIAYGITLTGLCLAVACCGGKDNGGGDDPPTPVVYQCNDGKDNDGDTLVDMADPGCSSPTDNSESPYNDVVAPGKITDLAAYTQTNTPETIGLEWTSPGDDGWTGAPAWFLIKYKICPDLNDCPISTETEWDNAIDLASVANAGSAGTVYSQAFAAPPGHLCFAIKTFDEANNESPLSNSPCADVISKAQWFVDFYLPTGRIYLDYDEVQSMMQGVPANNIPSRALDVGTVMARAPPGTGTPEIFRDYLLSLTNNIYNPWADIELCGKYLGGTVQSSLNWENINIPKGIVLHNRGPPTECSPGYQDPYTFTDQDMQELRNIFREHLILWVDANKTQYCNLTAPCAEGEEWSINH